MKKRNQKFAGIPLSLLVMIAGFLTLALTLYIGYRASISERKLFSVSLVALLAGIFFESFRVSDNWRTVAGIFWGNYLFSLSVFFPWKKEHTYQIEDHIAIWPYFFIAFYLLTLIVTYTEKVTAKLTEGITLLLSISFIYWAFDYGFIHFHTWYSILFVATGLLFSATSLLHALTNRYLSRTSRLLLSLWSTIIMVVFAADNIIRVYSNPEIENTYLAEGLYIGLQYFLLGVSLVYIVQNVMLLVSFLPNKHSSSYYRDLRETKEEHISRYSDEQVPIVQSLFCIVFAGTLYCINHYFQVLPRHTMIWLLLVTFPHLIDLISLIIEEKNRRRRTAA